MKHIKVEQYTVYYSYAVDAEGRYNVAGVKIVLYDQDITDCVSERAMQLITNILMCYIQDSAHILNAA